MTTANTTPGRTEAEQARAHAAACLQYGREALDRGDLTAAERHANQAEMWLAAARRKRFVR